MINMNWVYILMIIFCLCLFISTISLNKENKHDQKTIKMLMDICKLQQDFICHIGRSKEFAILIQHELPEYSPTTKEQL